MNGVVRTGTIPLGLSFDNDWDIAGVLDLLGSGLGKDLLRVRRAANRVALWTLEHGLLSQVRLYGVDLGTWTMGGAGTFGGASVYDDLLFYEPADGSAALWFL